MDVAYAVGEYRTGEAANTCMSRAIATSPRRACICVWGAGRTAAVDFTNVLNAQVLGLVGDAGYPIHAGDYCGHGSAYWSSGAYTFGNSEAQAAISAGVAFMATIPNVNTGKVCLFAGSMGVTDALNWYKANPTKVQCIGLSIPLLDLNDVITNDKSLSTGPTLGLDASMNGLSLPQASINCNATIAASGLSMATGLPGGGGSNKFNVKSSNGWQVITATGLANTGPGGKAQFTGCTGGTGTLATGGAVSQGYGWAATNAYGVVWPAVLSGAQLAANSPQAWGPTAGSITVPLNIWASANDPIASNTAACQAWAKAVAAAGGNVTPTVVDMGNVGHNSLALDARQLGAFFNANGGLT